MPASSFKEQAPNSKRKTASVLAVLLREAVAAGVCAHKEPAKDAVAATAWLAEAGGRLVDPAGLCAVEQHSPSGKASARATFARLDELGFAPRGTSLRGRRETRC